VVTHFGVDNPSGFHPTAPPPTVQGVPRLLHDLRGLQTLFQFEQPPERKVRTSGYMLAFYGFGDASGSGFGSTIQTASGIRYRYGLWGNDLVGQSSNYKELFNLSEAAQDHIRQITFNYLTSLVDDVACEAASVSLTACEFYLFTDNAVAEAAFYKGTSSNPKLFELILHLKQLELRHSFTLLIIHVSGHRMQAQGTDGLSRGDLFAGVMRGQPLLSQVPLHLSAIDRSPGVYSWCHSLAPNSYHLLCLSPAQWFTVGHGI
jgi:hypothetical protein